MAPLPAKILTHCSGVNIERLRRKATIVDELLAKAENSTVTLSKEVNRTLDSYEQHYTFLRKTAHMAFKSNAPLQRNQTLLIKQRTGLEDSIENVVDQIQIVRLKARAQTEDIERLIAENARLKERVKLLEQSPVEDPRERASRLWSSVEMEAGAQS